MATVNNIGPNESLKVSNPKINGNFANVNNQIVNHVAGSADKHNLDAIVNNSAVAGVSAKDALNEIKSTQEDQQDQITNLSFTGSEHDALVTASLVDTEGENFGPSGNATYLNGRLDKWENQFTSYKAEKASQSLPHGIQLGISGLGGTTIPVDNTFSELLADYNLKYFRFDYKWSLVETTLGVYDFSVYDSDINALLTAGVTPYIILDFGNTLYGYYQNLNTEAQRDGFRNFCVAVVDRYKNNNIIYEIWNEPNHHLFWIPQDKTAPYYYALALQAVYAPIKEADPTCRVAGCAISSGWLQSWQEPEPYDWMDSFCKYGGMEHMDYFSFHPYSNRKPEELTELYDMLRGYVYKYAKRLIPLVISEVGYSVVPDWDGSGNAAILTEEERVKYVLRTILLNQAAEIELTLLYTTYSRKTTTTNVEDWFGVFNSDNSPTTTATAIQSMLNALEGALLVQTYNQNPFDYIYKFLKPDNTYVDVYWTISAPHTVTIDGITYNLTDTPAIIPSTSSAFGLVKTVGLSKYMANANKVDNRHNPGTAQENHGEIFNDYKNQIAGEYSTAVGLRNVAYPGYAHFIIGHNSGWISLNNVAGLTIGINIVVKVNHGKSIITTITDIDALNKRIKVSNAYSGDWTHLVSYIDGNYYGAYASGANNFVSGRASKSSGISNVIIGESSTTAGVRNKVISDLAESSGEENIVGKWSKSNGAFNVAVNGSIFSISSYTGNVITMPSTTGLDVFDMVILKIQFAAPILTFITAITSTTITVSNSIYGTLEYVVSPSNLEPVHASGYSNLVSGGFGVAMGRNNAVLAQGGVALGYFNLVNGLRSAATGYFNIAANYAEQVVGKYSRTANTGGSATNQVGDAFVVGNGVGEGSRSNAFRVDYNGAAYGLSAYNASGADYAEYFEWLDGNQQQIDRRGLFVTLDGNKIRIANEDEYILGIISANPCVIGNGDEDWLGRWVRDEYGGFVYEESTDEETGIAGKRLKVNPDYNPELNYIPRSERPEWALVGMLGVITVHDDGTCVVNGYCKCNDNGIATLSSRVVDTYRVIERVSDNLIKIIFK